MINTYQSKCALFPPNSSKYFWGNLYYKTYGKELVVFYFLRYMKNKMRVSEYKKYNFIRKYYIGAYWINFFIKLVYNVIKIWMMASNLTK